MLRKKYDIHPTLRFNGNDILLYGNGKIRIDEGSYIGGLSTIQAEENSTVAIGKYCMISHNVRIYTSSAIADQDFSSFPHKTRTGDVSIGDFCWIGANVFINPGVSIGSNAVVGANSVVTKDLPGNTIFAGVPARLIRSKTALEK